MLFYCGVCYNKRSALNNFLAANTYVAVIVVSVVDVVVAVVVDASTVAVAIANACV